MRRPERGMPRRAIGILILLTGVNACTRVTGVLPPEPPRPPPAESPPPERRLPADPAPGTADLPVLVPRAEPRSPYGNPDSYEVFGKRYRVMDSSDGYVERGVASWYGREFHGRRTSSGESYDMHALSAAHRTLPLPTYVEVTNLENGRKVVVRINDRGPFHGDRIIDLSYAAAVKLGMAGKGTARVEVRALKAVSGS